MIMPDIDLNSMFCCLIMKSVLNILGYFLEQFQRFSWGLPYNFLNRFHLQTIRKSCWQPKMSGWIETTMQQNTTYFPLFQNGEENPLYKVLIFSLYPRTTALSCHPSLSSEQSAVTIAWCLLELFCLWGFIKNLELKVDSNQTCYML